MDPLRGALDTSAGASGGAGDELDAFVAAAPHSPRASLPAHALHGLLDGQLPRLALLGLGARSGQRAIFGRFRSSFSKQKHFIYVMFQRIS